jgi:hypothetical protein
LYGKTQAEVGIGVASAMFGGNDYLTCQFGKELTALGVGGPFLPFDG